MAMSPMPGQMAWLPDQNGQQILGTWQVVAVGEPQMFFKQPSPAAPVRVPAATYYKQPSPVAPVRVPLAEPSSPFRQQLLAQLNAPKVAAMQSLSDRDDRSLSPDQPKKMSNLEKFERMRPLLQEQGQVALRWNPGTGLWEKVVAA